MAKAILPQHFFLIGSEFRMILARISSGPRSDSMAIRRCAAARFLSRDDAERSPWRAVCSPWSSVKRCRQSSISNRSPSICGRSHGLKHVSLVECSQSWLFQHSGQRRCIRNIKTSRLLQQHHQPQSLPTQGRLLRILERSPPQARLDRQTSP